MLFELLYPHREVLVGHLVSCLSKHLRKRRRSQRHRCRNHAEREDDGFHLGGTTVEHRQRADQQNRDEET